MPSRKMLLAYGAIALMTVGLPAKGLAQSVIDPPSAHQQASTGDILLVDVRRPSEWRETGVAQNASLISMHEDGFFEKLDEAVGGDHGRAIAVICAAGGRSTWMQAQLMARGYTNVWNVAEGMVGGPNGPGWIERGLPIRTYSD